MSIIDIIQVNDYLAQTYREGYQNTNLIIPPVALPIGSYRMDRSDEPSDGAIFVGTARLTPITDVNAVGNRDALLKVTRPNAFAFAPYSDSQFFVTNIIEEDGELGQDDTDENTVNIYSNSVGRD